MEQEGGGRDTCTCPHVSRHRGVEGRTLGPPNSPKKDGAALFNCVLRQDGRTCNACRL